MRLQTGSPDARGGPERCGRWGWGGDWVQMGCGRGPRKGLVPLRGETGKCTFSVSPTNSSLLPQRSSPPCEAKPERGPEGPLISDFRPPERASGTSVSVSELSSRTSGSLTERKIFLRWPFAALSLRPELFCWTTPFPLKPELMSLRGESQPWSAGHPSLCHTPRLVWPHPLKSLSLP